MNNAYELNEKDVESTLNFLRIFDSKNATPEKAIAFLEYMYVGAHMMQHTNPEGLEELYNVFIEQNQEKQ